MTLFKTASDLSDHLHSLVVKGKVTGFVPTMGALHAGHLSLIAESRQSADVTVCSIFVNPTQFNDPADFEKYPVTLENDIRLLEQAGCNILFVPSVKEMYPNGMVNTGNRFDPGFLDTVLEGSKRPGHFAGVAQVMQRLLTIVNPALLFMGQKDYQQCMVVQQLINQGGYPTKLVIVPTVREESGLAMSSRNTRLSDNGRARAAIINKALQHLKKSITPGNLNGIIKEAEEMIFEKGFDRIDYVSVANADTLEPVTVWDGTIPLVALVAAFTEGVRLIDNILLAN